MNYWIMHTKQTHIYIPKSHAPINQLLMTQINDEQLLKNEADILISVPTVLSFYLRHDETRAKVSD